MALSETILIAMGLLTLAIAAAGIFRKSPIPYTVILVVLGMLMAGLGRYFTPFAVLEDVHLSPELVFFVFLPALIFESGLNINSRQLIKELAAVLMLAIPALIISTLMIGAGLWQILNTPLLTALLFGALISATDPVAVVALFKELGAPLRLTVLVEGESLMNDATAIVVFGIVLDMTIQRGGDASIWFAAIDFLRVFLGGTLCGVVLGLLACEFMARLHLPASATLTLSIVLAYTSFILAEHVFHVSGVMATASAAIMMGAYGVPRMEAQATAALGETWELLAYICNVLLFLLIGLSVDFDGITASIGPIIIAVILVLIARAATVYSLIPITTRLFSLPRIGMSERHIMWWGGLKGGLAIAIVLSIPKDLPGRDLLLELTLGTVLFTLLVNAPTIRPFMSRLGLDKLDDEEQADFQQALFNAEQRALSTLESFQEAGLTSKTNAVRSRQLIAKTFATELPTLSKNQQQRHLFTLAIRTEMEELNHLLELGIITQYTFHDIRNVLQRDRDTKQKQKQEQEQEQEQDKNRVSRAVQNPFLRLERSLLRRLRERDWAAGLLARYQNMRLSQRLQRDIAGIIICEVVLAMLSELDEYEPQLRKEVAAVYNQRLASRQERLEVLRQEFPEVCQRFESRLLSHVALNRALQGAREDERDGQLGAKGFTLVQKIISAALQTLPPLSSALPSLDSRALLALVPFLQDLPDNALAELARHTHTVSILPGDIIIGDRERGDSMYIIAHGEIGVYRDTTGKDEIAVLGEGDFFGEMALLGSQVRNATVRARSPGALLRLRRRDVLNLAKTYPEIMQRLREVENSRRNSTITTTP